MYVDSNHLNYKYVYNLSDNYIVLCNRSNINGSFDNPQTVNLHVQYLYPSTLSYDYSEVVRSSRALTEIDVSDNFYARADCPQLILAIFVCIFYVLFIINGLTRFVKRGGVFFGS